MFGNGWTSLRIVLIVMCLVFAGIDALAGMYGWCVYLIGCAILQVGIAEFTKEK